MPTAQFRRNRAAFPFTELAKYQGQWVAFDPDGTKIIAGNADLIVLDKQVRAAGYNPEEVMFEGVPDEEEGLHLDDGEII